MERSRSRQRRRTAQWGYRQGKCTGSFPSPPGRGTPVTVEILWLTMPLYNKIKL